MKLWDRFRTWRTRRRHQKAAKRRGKAGLREFVYLDDVSVYSLLASRKGTIPAQVTESESALMRGEVASSVGANAGVAKGEVSSAMEVQQTTAAQVVRKALVQSTFKELLDLEGPTLPLKAGAKADGVPRPADASALQQLAASAPTPWIAPLADLRRGTLLELEVELEAESIFRMSAIMTAFFEILDQNPKLVDSASFSSLLDSFMVNQMLERLMVGLVPIRGRAVDYSHVTVGDQELAVHRRVLEGLSNSTDISVRPLFVVGVAERDLFWRDIRRVLFSHSRHTVLCRVSQSGAQSTWTPVKLVDVLKEVAPELGSSILEAGSVLDDAGEGDESLAVDDERRAAMSEALRHYGEELGRRNGAEDPGALLAELSLPTPAQAAAFETLEGRRAAFNEITEQLEARLEFKGDALDSAQLRAKSLADAGFAPDGSFSVATARTADSDLSADDPRYLDTNIVAIYW